MKEFKHILKRRQMIELRSPGFCNREPPGTRIVANYGFFIRG